MRVFHGPVDVAWQGSTLAAELRRQGIDAISVGYSRRKSSMDETVIIDRGDPIIWLVRQFKTFFKYGFSYDIYHFHFAKSFLPLNLDLPILKLLGKKIVFHFHGCDIRNHHHSNVACGQCNVGYRDVQQPVTKWLGEHLADKVYVSTPDLLQDYPKAEYLPVAYPWPIKQVKTSKRLIVHAATDPSIKGTKFVLDAAKRLTREYKIKFKFLEGVPHEDAQKTFREALAGVDQLLLGWHGLFSLEFLAQGKPVLCYINSELLKYQRDLPVLNTSSEMIYNDLRNILEGKYSFDAARAVSFVKRVHSPEAIAKRLIEDYSKL